MRSILKTIVVAIGLMIPAVAVIGAGITADAMSAAHRQQHEQRTAHRQQHEQRTAQQQGTLAKCYTADEVIADAKKGAADEYEGHRLLTSGEVAQLVQHVFENHGVMFATKQMLVIYLKTVAVVLTGSGDDGKFCEFEVVDKKAMRALLDRVLGVVS